MNCNKSRNYTIDLLKFISANIIMLGHTNEVLKSNLFSGIFKSSSIMVMFFFIVSGYYMAQSSEKPIKKNVGYDTFIFIIRKYKKMIIPILVSFIIGFIILNYNSDFYNIINHLILSFWELSLTNMFGMYTYTVISTTWYISSMIFAMFIIYPIMRISSKDMFFLVIVPFTYLFTLGVIYQNTEKILRGNSAWYGIILHGSLYAICMILGGCISYRVSLLLKCVQFTKLSKVLLFIIEWTIYCGVILCSYIGVHLEYKFIISVLLIISVSITMSNVTNNIYINSFISSYLGELSFYIFLCHYFLLRLPLLFVDNTMINKYIFIYITFVYLFAIIIRYISKVIENILSKNKQRIMGLFIST